MIQFFNTFEPVTDFYRDLIPALSQSGLKSRVLVSTAAYRRGRPPLSEVAARVEVTAIPAGVRRADTRLRKLVTMATYSLGAALVSLFNRRPSLNFFLTQPPLFAVWGRVLRALRGTPYCCLVMDLYPHVLAAGGTLGEDSLFYRGLRRLMLGTLAAADGVFVIGRCMRDRLIAEGVPPGRIVLMTNWAHDDAIRPVSRDRNRLAARVGVSGEFVVLYSGNMGVAHDFRTILDSAQRLRHRADIRFLFFGEGVQRLAVEREVAARGLQNVTVEGLQPHDALAESQSLGDVHFVTLRPTFTGLVVPSKAYSALAAGRPLLYEGAADGEIARTVAEENVGRVIAPGDAGAMVEAITSMQSDHVGTAAAGARARRLAEDRLGRNAAVARYVEAVRALVHTSNAAAAP